MKGCQIFVDIPFLYAIIMTMKYKFGVIMMKKSVFSFLGVLMVSTTIAHAQVPTPAQQLTDDIKVTNALEKATDASVPSLAYLRAQGVTLTYLGNDGGNEGYLGIAPDGKMQAFYLSNDKTKLIPGMMFGFMNKQVVNVTADQILSMKNRVLQEKAALERKQADIQKGQDAIKTESSDLDARTKLINQASTMLNGNETGDIKNDGNIPMPANNNTPVPATGSTADNSMDKWLVPNADIGKFAKDIDNVYWFSVGKKDAKVPVLYMIADPQCPFCHRAWGEIRNLVFSGKLNVHIIMISGLPGSDGPAAELLSRANPGLSWLQGEGSTDGAIPMSTPTSAKEYKAAENYVHVNSAYANRMNVKKTPWLAYIKNGKLYELQGDNGLMDYVNGLIK